MKLGNGIGCLGVAATIAVACGCVASRSAEPASMPSPQGNVQPSVPAALRLPANEGNQMASIAAHGTGVQIYECRQNAQDPASFEWTLKAPEAQLRYDAGKPLGKHYAGPTWEADDGSKVVGEVVARNESPDSTAIPWLLLRAKQTSGSGTFSAVRWIQRLHTVGGIAPTVGCAQAYAGTEVRVDYSADYYFYAAP